MPSLTSFKYLALLLISVNGILSCTSKELNTDTIKAKDNYNNERELKTKILNADTLAYYQLYSQYYENDNAVDFVPWALIMANKFKYKRAYSDVFECVQAAHVYYGKYDSSKNRYPNILVSTTIAFSISFLNQLGDAELVKRRLKQNGINH